MKISVVGIGNPIATDDGVGIWTVGRLRNVVDDRRVRCLQTERGGLDLLELLEGSSLAFLVDAARSGSASPGTISIFRVTTPYQGKPLPSLHTVGLFDVLSFGAASGFEVPEEVIILTVETKDIETFREGCTPEVENAIPQLVNRLVAEIQKVLPDLSLSEAGFGDTEQPVNDTTSTEFV